MPFLLVICFTVSGATSLLLQVVWVRRLIGVFGASSLAIATVLATFMAGLALGSWLGGKAADKLDRMVPSKSESRLGMFRDPLFYYGAAELLVGVAALLILPLIDQYRGANAWLWQQLGDTPWLLACARFALTATVLLIPTTAMGATLPLLTRKVTRVAADLHHLGNRLGILYAANTFGALIGAAAAGFWLIPLWGVSQTNQLAAGLAIGLGAGVAVIAWRGKGNSGRTKLDALVVEAKIQIDEPVGHSLTTSGRERRVVLCLYAASGAIAMALEVLWSRTLAIVNGSSTYSFTIVLCTFLVGISLGSAAAAKLWGKTRRPFAVLAGLFLVAGLGIALFHLLASRLPELFLAIVEGTELDVDTVLSVHVFLSAIIIVPTALALGAVMPVAIRAYVGDVNEVGADVGVAYASNTVGAIIGSVAAGFVLLPGPGLELSARLAIVAMAGLSAWAAWMHGRHRVLLGLSVTIAALAFASPSWNRSDFTSGLFRTHQASRYIRNGGLFQRDVVFYKDGMSTTVSVERLGGSWVLRNNGKVEASDRHDMPTQILVGLMPVLLHGGEAQEVFLVGYGSGVTVGSIAIAPMVESVEVVELEPEVYVAADRYFGGFNNEPEKNSKVTRLLGDGRNVLLASGKKYDVIVSEPSNPWIAGVATLFTREFYQLAKQHLKADGVFCQWAQLYELGPSNVKMIYRTFSESFRFVYAFTPGDETTDTILIGSDRPLALDLLALDKMINATPRFRGELERAEIRQPADIVASLLLAPSEVPAFTAGAAINTDDNAKLEYAAPHDLLASANTGHFARLVRGDTWPYGYLDGLVEGLDDRDGGRSEAEMARALMTYGRLRRAQDWLDKARAQGYDTDDLEAILHLAEPRDFLDPELAITEGGPPLPRPNSELFASISDTAADRLAEGYQEYASGRFGPGWQVVRRLPRRAGTQAAQDVSLLMAYLAYKAIELDQALKLLGPLASDQSFVARRPSVLYYAARAHFGLGHFRDAIELFERFQADVPDMAASTLKSKL